MAENELEAQADQSFSDAEVGTLSGVAADWVNEVIVVHPYPDELGADAVFAKLGITPGEQYDLMLTAFETTRVRRLPGG